MVSNDTSLEVTHMSDEALELKEIVRICSSVSLDDGSLTFDSFGSSETRIDTLRFLTKMNKTLEDAEGVINSISETDYFRGPTDNYDPNRRKHQLWEFKKQAFGVLLYIKIIPYNKNRYIVVVSFHENR